MVKYNLHLDTEEKDIIKRILAERINRKRKNGFELFSFVILISVYSIMLPAWFILYEIEFDITFIVWLLLGAIIFFGWSHIFKLAERLRNRVLDGKAYTKKREDLREQNNDVNTTSVAMKVLYIITDLLFIVTVGYLGIKVFYPRAAGEEFRTWFSANTSLVLIILWGCLDLIWQIIAICKVNKGESKLRALMIVCTAIVGLLCAGYFLLCIGVYALRNEIERENENGTLTVATDDGYGRSYELCKKESALTRKHIRFADGWDDTDPNRTNLIVPKESEIKIEEVPEQSEKDNQVDIEEIKDEEAERIEEGNKAIFEVLNSDGSDYEEIYDAKGNSIVIVQEDVATVRFIKFNKMIEKGTIGQYVYFESKKDTDGAWTWTEAEILDTYNYVYQTKEVIATGQKSW